MNRLIATVLIKAQSSFICYITFILHHWEAYSFWSQFNSQGFREDKSCQRIERTVSASKCYFLSSYKKHFSKHWPEHRPWVCSKHGLLVTSDKLLRLHLPTGRNSKGLKPLVWVSLALLTTWSAWLQDQPTHLPHWCKNGSSSLAQSRTSTLNDSTKDRAWVVFHQGWRMDALLMCKFFVEPRKWFVCWSKWVLVQLYCLIPQYPMFLQLSPGIWGPDYPVSGIRCPATTLSCDFWRHLLRLWYPPVPPLLR